MKVEEIKIGTPVTYYSTIKGNGEKLNPISSIITSKPWTLGNGEIVCNIDGVSGVVSIALLEKRIIGKNLKQGMKAKVFPASQGFDPGEEGFMILIKNSENSQYRCWLIEDGEPYFTKDKEEAEAKAEKLNEKFKS